MARAPKSNSPGPDGMSWIALMPFPAFNPLNWWALANPANAFAANMHATRAALDAWRAGADGMRMLLRAQQDAMLALAETEKAEPAAQDGAAAPAEDTIVSTEFVRPMLEVTRAYGQMGRAFIVAQRDTMRAFTEAGKAH